MSDALLRGHTYSYDEDNVNGGESEERLGDAMKLARKTDITVQIVSFVTHASIQ